jgi:hypothetical protein
VRAVSQSASACSATKTLPPTRVLTGPVPARQYADRVRSVMPHRAAAWVVVSRSPTRSKGRDLVMTVSVSGEVLSRIMPTNIAERSELINYGFPKFSIFLKV